MLYRLPNSGATAMQGRQTRLLNGTIDGNIGESRRIWGCTKARLAMRAEHRMTRYFDAPRGTDTELTSLTLAVRTEKMP